METIAGAERTAHVVWVSEEARIASFHPVKGYLPRRFWNHAFLWAICTPCKDAASAFSEGEGAKQPCRKGAAVF